jgi:hypothetical protein
VQDRFFDLVAERIGASDAKELMAKATNQAG